MVKVFGVGNLRMNLHESKLNNFLLFLLLKYYNAAVAFLHINYSI